MLRALVRFYQTGDLKDWHDYNVLWIQNDEEVDFASGFIEVYRDPAASRDRRRWWWLWSTRPWSR